MGAKVPLVTPQVLKPGLEPQAPWEQEEMVVGIEPDPVVSGVETTKEVVVLIILKLRVLGQIGLGKAATCINLMV